jgi:hypothetical protein
MLNCGAFDKILTLDTQLYQFVRFEILTAVVITISIFWDKTPCYPLKFNRRFGGTYRFHFQGIYKTRIACSSILIRECKFR